MSRPSHWEQKALTGSCANDDFLRTWAWLDLDPREPHFPAPAVKSRLPLRIYVGCIDRARLHAELATVPTKRLGPHAKDRQRRNAERHQLLRRYEAALQRNAHELAAQCTVHREELNARFGDVFDALIQARSDALTRYAATARPTGGARYDYSERKALNGLPYDKVVHQRAVEDLKATLHAILTQLVTIVISEVSHASAQL